MCGCNTWSNEIAVTLEFPLSFTLVVYLEYLLLQVASAGDCGTICYINSIAS